MPKGVVIVWKPEGLKKKSRLASITFLHLALAELANEAKRKCTELNVVDTGRLRASITYEIDTQRLTGRFGTNVEYAWYQEEGTSKGLVGRHYLRKALEARKQDIVRLWKM